MVGRPAADVERHPDADHDGGQADDDKPLKEMIQAVISPPIAEPSGAPESISVTALARRFGGIQFAKSLLPGDAGSLATREAD